MKQVNESEQLLREWVSINLKRLREGISLNQTQMSKQLLKQNPQCGLIPKRISDIEGRRCSIYIQELVAYSKYFDCSFESLLEKPVAPVHYPLSLEEVREAAYHLTVRVERLEEAHNATNEVITAREESYNTFTVQVLKALQDIQDGQDAPEELF
jgi:hypothetical protein